MTAQAHRRLINSTAIRRQDRALLHRLVKSFQATAQHGRLHLLAGQLVAGGFEDVHVDIFKTPSSRWDIAIQYSRGPSERLALDGRREAQSVASRGAQHGR